MIRTIRNYSLIAGMLVIASLISAQNSINSPLTRIGLGEVHPDDLQSQRFRGFTSTAAMGEYESNIRNPSALGRLKAANFDIGITARNIILETQDGRSDGWYGSFDYLLLSFPIFNPINDALNRDSRDFKWGMMLGIKPYTNIGYDVEFMEVLDDETMITKSYSGDGGTYKIMWGNGFNYKDFSLGFRLEYILGEMNFNSSSSIDEVGAYVTEQYRSTYIRALNYDIGAQYRLVLDREVPLAEGLKGEPKQYLNFGVSASSKINADFTQNYLNLNRYAQSSIVDTILQRENVIESGVLPGHLEFGIMYQHNNSLSVLTDFQYQAWSNYENPNQVYELRNNYRFGLGIEYIPEPDALRGYLNRVKYYIGGHIGNDPRVLNGEQLSDMGISAGFTLPFIGRRRRAYASFSFFYRKKQVGDITENYYGIGLSFKGTDNQWFVKPKFE